VHAGVNETLRRDVLWGMEWNTTSPNVARTQYIIISDGQAIFISKIGESRDPRASIHFGRGVAAVDKNWASDCLVNEMAGENILLPRWLTVGITAMLD